jgi:hypothetical protein
MRVYVSSKLGGSGEVEEFYTSRPSNKEICALYFRHPVVTLKWEGVT